MYDQLLLAGYTPPRADVANDWRRTPRLPMNPSRYNRFNPAPVPGLEPAGGGGPSPAGYALAGGVNSLPLPATAAPLPQSTPNVPTPPEGAAQAGAGGSGFMSRLGGGVNSFLGGDESLAFAAGLMGNRNQMQQAFTNAYNARAGDPSRGSNATAAWLMKQNRRDLAQLAATGQGAAALKLYQDSLRAGTDEGTSAMQNWRFMQGLPSDQRDEFAQAMNAGGVNVSLADSKPVVKLLAKEAEAGTAAAQKMQQINMLEASLSSSPSGSEAAIKSFLGEFGVETQGLSAIQTSQALINQIAPQQRAPGSGPMSDADLNLYLKSLPRLINTPGSNAAIIAGMRHMAQFDMAMADVAMQALSEEITPREAQEMKRQVIKEYQERGKSIAAQVKEFLAADGKGEAGRSSQQVIDEINAEFGF